jgi:hypothetical protein
MLFKKKKKKISKKSLNKNSTDVFSLDFWREKNFIVKKKSCGFLIKSSNKKKEQRKKKFFCQSDLIQNM